MAQAISRKKLVTQINFRGKSPRIVVPLTDSLETLDDNTNLFILYLGDLNFQNIIRPTLLTSNNSKYEFELLNFKLEFWEDYVDALEALNYEEDANIQIKKLDKGKLLPSFLMLEFSAFLAYQV